MLGYLLTLVPMSLCRSECVCVYVCSVGSLLVCLYVSFFCLRPCLLVEGPRFLHLISARLSLDPFFCNSEMNIALFAPPKELCSSLGMQLGALCYRMWNWLSKWRQDRSSNDPRPSRRLVSDSNFT